VNQATAERMITVGMKDQAMILIRRLFHQLFFIPTPGLSFVWNRRIIHFIPFSILTKGNLVFIYISMVFIHLLLRI
jgi:hypothetical protein